MANQDDIEQILTVLCKVHPHDVLHEIDRTSEGQGAVLHYLARQNEPVTAGQVAKALHSSTARTTIILKKLQAKNLITRRSGEKDARTTVVALSEKGIEEISCWRNQIYYCVNMLIDEIGMERLMAFAETAQDIRQVLEKLKAGGHCNK